MTFNPKPEDIVKSCRWLEKGCYVHTDGVRACVHGSRNSPLILTSEEINKNDDNYELFVKRKKEIFDGINGKNEIDIDGCLNCTNIVEKKFKDVSFESVGGEHIPGAMGIQHYTYCNERCLYCCYAQTNDFRKPGYDILKVYEMLSKRNMLGKNNWIDFSGGEPALLKDFEKIMTYIDEHDMGTVVVYSNASIYSQKLCDLLRDNKIILTTSVDTGLRSTYAHLRGLDVFPKVFENLVRYRNSGTKNLWLKYVITEHNRTEDDLYSFLMMMLAIRPDKVMICPDFPYGDKLIPEETVKFAAKLWYLLEKYMGIIAQDYTSAMGDPKFLKYRKEVSEEIERLKKEHPIDGNLVLSATRFETGCTCDLEKKKSAVDINSTKFKLNSLMIHFLRYTTFGKTRKRYKKKWKEIKKMKKEKK